MNWVALFSQTGSEICQISQKLNRWPDLVLCNKQDGFEHINKDLLHGGDTVIIFTDKSPTVDQYLQYIREDDLVTMHGWLRIVPGEVCEQRNIYNGHPGDIVTYPELKGKDPQQKAIDLGHREAGCVLHKATAELDDGPIVAVSEKVIIQDRYEPEEFTALHDASVDMWVKFLKGRLAQR